MAGLALTHKQGKFLRRLAHNRKPVIWLGQHGLTENVLAEIEAALDYHELIKIKLRIGERDERNSLLEDICTVTGAEQVQQIGTTATIFRKNRGKSGGINLPR